MNCCNKWVNLKSLLLPFYAFVNSRKKTQSPKYPQKKKNTPTGLWGKNKFYEYEVKEFSNTKS